jgi:hypothetical protein
MNQFVDYKNKKKLKFESEKSLVGLIVDSLNKEEESTYVIWKELSLRERFEKNFCLNLEW